MERIIFIAGPTASGKSALALELAQALDNFVIINGDSLQLYCDLKILTARPNKEDFQGISHYLYGELSYAVLTDASWWQHQVLKLLKKHQNILIVGGTGLYLNTLIRGLSPMPEIPEAIRHQVRAQAARLSSADFQAWAYEIDPQLQNRLSDPQRLTRAIEVKLASGESILHWQGQAKPAINHYRFITLLPPRETLYHRINQRFEWMMNHGAIEEVEKLNQLPLPLKSPLYKAIGVKEITAYLNGDLTRLQVVDKAQQATRNYAKRQMTWFRHQAPQDIVVTEEKWNLETLQQALSHT